MRSASQHHTPWCHSLLSLLLLTRDVEQCVISYASLVQDFKLLEVTVQVLVEARFFSGLRIGVPHIIHSNPYGCKCVFSRPRCVAGLRCQVLIPGVDLVDNTRNSGNICLHKKKNNKNTNNSKVEG